MEDTKLMQNHRSSQLLPLQHLIFLNLASIAGERGCLITFEQVNMVLGIVHQNLHLFIIVMY